MLCSAWVGVGVLYETVKVLFIELAAAAEVKAPIPRTGFFVGLFSPPRCRMLISFFSELYHMFFTPP
jgi:hypothetical protein